MDRDYEPEQNCLGELLSGGEGWGQLIKTSDIHGVMLKFYSGCDSVSFEKLGQVNTAGSYFY